MRHQDLFLAVGSCALLGLLCGLLMGPAAADVGGPGPVLARGLTGAVIGGAVGAVLGHMRRVSVPLAVVVFTGIFGALLFLPVFESKSGGRYPLGAAYVNDRFPAAKVFVWHLVASLGLTACSMGLRSLWTRRR